MFVQTYFTYTFGYRRARNAYRVYKTYMATDAMCRMSTLLTAEKLLK